MSEPRSIPAYVAVDDGLHVSLFRGARDSMPARACFEPDDLVRWVGQPLGIDDKSKRPAWSPALYAPGATRSNRHVQALSALVLDYDDGLPWAEGLSPWRDWVGLAHTSWSHTADQHRYRVILPFRAPVDPVVWPRVWKWAQDRAGRQIDKACKDAARLYYVPCRPDTWAACKAYQWDVWRGTVGMLDVDALDLPAPALRAPKPISLDVMRERFGDAYQFGAPTRIALEAQDPQAALDWALAEGGRVATAPTALAVGFMCPRCGQGDTWIGSETVLAMCRHRTTCDWKGRPWLKR